MEIVQIYADKCRLCRLCIDVCPSYDSIEIIPALCDYISSEKNEIPPDFDIRLCYTCNVCTKACPEELGIRKLISASREKKTKEYGKTEEQGLADPFSENNIYKKISEWEKPTVFKNEGKKSEVVYFPGCAASCMNKVIGKSTIKVLEAAGVDYSVMSGIEYCCGSVAAGAGNFEPLQRLGQKNIDEINRRGAKTLITACPGCYRAFKILYPQKFENINFEVIQTSEYFVRLLDEGKLKLKKDMGKRTKENGTEKIKLFYQDPCHLTRAIGIYNEPRRVLSTIPGAELVNDSPENSVCCGFGGGVRVSFPEKSIRQAEKVHDHAREAGSDVIITNCGGCMKNIIEGGMAANANVDAEKESGCRNTGLPVYDLAEFISLACGNAPVERDDEKLIRLSNQAMTECLSKYDFDFCKSIEKNENEKVLIKKND